MSHHLDPTVHAYFLKLSHKIVKEGQVLRLLTDYKSVSVKIDSLSQNDVVFANGYDLPIFVTTPGIANHLESRPLVLKRGVNGYFLDFKDRRRAKRLSIA